MQTSKEICECTHPKSSHVMDLDNTRCCACWQNEKGTRMCDCMAFKLKSAVKTGGKGK